MTADDCVTVWHFDSKSGEFINTVYEKAYVREKKKISKSRIKQRGFCCDDSLVVRIPTECALSIAAGDYLCRGKDLSDEPNRETTFKIIGINDNRRGLSPHYRLFCGG